MKLWATALLLLLSAPSLAHGQDWWRVYPTRPANDSWYTGVTELSPDGRWAGGWQTPYSSAPSAAPAVWDTVTRAPRARQPGKPGYLRDLGPTPLTYVGNTSGDSPWAGWRCIETGEQYCENLASFRTIWSCSDDGATVLGFLPHPEFLISPAVLRPDGTVKLSGLNLAVLNESAVSGDGSVAYLLAGSPVVNLYRWELTGDAPPEVIREGTHYGLFIVGQTIDGTVAYISSETSFERYKHPGEWEEIGGWGPGRVHRVTRDGLWATGLFPLGSQPGGGRAGYLWTPFTGSIPLTEFIPNFSTRLGRVIISNDGSTIAGTFRASESSWMSYGFVGKLPPDLRSLAGDYSTDGNLDQDDIAEYIGLLAGMPNPKALPMDFNRDGSADTDDLSDLVTFIAGGGAP